MFEFGLLAAAMPAMSEKRLQTIFRMDSATRDQLQSRADQNRPLLVAAPHLGPQEGLCLLPLFLSNPPPLGSIYRPLDHRALETFILNSRQRFGVTLFSRKRALQSSIRILRQNGWLAVFFDQNSGRKGALLTFFDRVASVTELPGMLASRHEADILYLYAARRAFWRIDLCVEAGPSAPDRNTAVFATNQWLENLLREREELIPGWLWAHNRWRLHRRPRLCLDAKSHLLDEQNRYLKRKALPRREPFLIRLPDRLDEAKLLLPLLRALRRSRPDAALILLGQPDALPLFEESGLCERAIPLPANAWRRLRLARELRWIFPTFHLLFNDRASVDFEAWLTGAVHRLGIEGKRRRRLLTATWRPEPADRAAGDLLSVWTKFLEHFQMDGKDGHEGTQADTHG